MFQHYQPYLLFLIAVLFSFTSSAQHTVSGVVTQANGNPIMGANVYLEGTYDGATTTEDGTFSFETSEEGTYTLVISFIS